MEKKNDVFVMDLPNIGNDELLRIVQLILNQSDFSFEGYRIENETFIIDVLIKT